MQQESTTKLCFHLLVGWTHFVRLANRLQKDTLNRNKMMQIWWEVVLVGVALCAGSEYGFTTAWLPSLTLSNYSTTHECSCNLRCSRLECKSLYWHAANQHHAKTETSPFKKSAACLRLPYWKILELRSYILPPSITLLKSSSPSSNRLHSVRHHITTLCTTGCQVKMDMGLRYPINVQTDHRQHVTVVQYIRSA